MALPFRDIVSRLPKDFVEEIYNTFPLSTAEKILRGYGQDRRTTLRVNTIKYDVRSALKDLWEKNIKTDRVPWYKNALIIKEKREKDIEVLDIYANGLIYLQSLSSMIPPLVLEPRPGDTVLDMTAAPGSKTTQIAALMENKGQIIANDVDKIRVERLKYNIDIQGATIVKVTCQDGTKLGDKHPETFDKILLDAPCSGEGLFLAKDSRTYRQWSTRTVKRSAALQRRLMTSAIKSLKPGGSLVYSTCTLSPEENELIIEDTLSQFKDILQIQNINIKVPDLQYGITKYRDLTLHPDIKKTRRVLPSELMEGFFICKLKKL